MSEALRFEEAEPETLPTLTRQYEDGSTDTLDVIPHVWRRLESYISRRWNPRQAVWTVQGPGDWRPHLTPVSNLVVDRWNDDTHVWDSVTVNANPVGGLYLPQACIYRVTATVGADAGAVPQLVVLAYQRLAAYAVEAELSTTPAGAASHSLKLGDGLDETIDRNPAWIARALQYSGAADLLRGYRRA